MTRFIPIARLWAMLLFAAILPVQLYAAPFAAYVMDARTGQPIYEQNANTRLHPASLTKMMTLYMAFSAIERGQVRLDSKFTISSKAASEPPSKLGLRAGQQIELRYLIRAAAIKSANDAATAIGEGLAGSEAAFTQQMTATAKALGMRNTQFRNAHGLTQEGHYSTARDMSILGRRLFYDFPQYYNIFSRRTADAGIATVASTNRRFLDDYAGADGIKTGYTRAAGFNLTASAQRGNKRLIATVFGGNSTAHRNQVMAQLLDSGFNRVPSRVREVRPEPPQLLAQRVVRRAQVQPSEAVTRAEPQRLVLTASAAPRRVSRQADAQPARNAFASAPPSAAAAASQASSGLRLTSSAKPRPRPVRSDPIEAAVALAVAAPVAASETAASAGGLAGSALSTSKRPPRASSASRGGIADVTPAAQAAPHAAAEKPLHSEGTLTLEASKPPKPRSETVILAAMGEGDIDSAPVPSEIVRRPADNARNWGVSLGTYPSRAQADRLLIRTAIKDGDILGNAHRGISDTNRGFRADFANLSKSEAELACSRLIARQQSCTVVQK